MYMYIHVGPGEFPSSMTSLLSRKCSRKRKHSKLEEEREGEGGGEGGGGGGGEEESGTSLPLSMVKYSTKTNNAKTTKKPQECSGSVAMDLEGVWREQGRER